MKCKRHHGQRVLRDVAIQPFHAKWSSSLHLWYPLHYTRDARYCVKHV